MKRVWHLCNTYKQHSFPTELIHINLILIILIPINLVRINLAKY